VTCGTHQGNRNRRFDATLRAGVGDELLAVVQLLQRQQRRLEGCRDSYFIAEQPAPAPHLAHPERCAALFIVLFTVSRVSRSCENFPDGFDLHLLLEGCIRGRI